MYPVLVVPIANDAGRNIGGEHALITMALGTGGRVFEPTLGAALDSAFSEIIKDLRTQYLLAYYPKGVPLSKNRYHRLQVSVRRADLRVTARSGYYGEAEDDRPQPGAGMAPGGSFKESQLRKNSLENPGIALPRRLLKK